MTTEEPFNSQPGNDDSTSKKPDCKPKPSEAVAVIAVHGVADQRPGETARQIGNMLLEYDHLRDDEDTVVQDNILYNSFEEESIRIAGRSVTLNEPFLTWKEWSEELKKVGVTSEKIVGEQWSDVKIGVAELDEPNLLPRKLRKEVKANRPSLVAKLKEKAGEVAFSPWFREIYAQLKEHEDEGTGGCYETVRLEGVRADRNQPSRPVHLYEMYWADLSRLGTGMLSVFRAIYQLLFEMTWVGTRTLEAESRPESPAKEREVTESGPSEGSPEATAPSDGEQRKPLDPKRRRAFGGLARLQAFYGRFLTILIPIQSTIVLGFLALLYISGSLELFQEKYIQQHSGSGVKMDIYLSIVVLLAFGLAFGLVQVLLGLLSSGPCDCDPKKARPAGMTFKSRFLLGILTGAAAAVWTWFYFESGHADLEATAGFLMWLAIGAVIPVLVLRLLAQRQKQSWVKWGGVILLTIGAIVFALGLNLGGSEGSDLSQPLAAATFGFLASSALLVAFWMVLFLLIFIFILGFMVTKVLLFRSHPSYRNSLWTGLMSVVIPAIATLVINVGLWHAVLWPLKPLLPEESVFDEVIKVPQEDWHFDLSNLGATREFSVAEIEKWIAFTPGHRISAYLETLEGGPGTARFSELIKHMLSLVPSPAIEFSVVLLLLFVAYSAWCFFPAIRSERKNAGPLRNRDKGHSCVVGGLIDSGFRGLKRGQFALTISLALTVLGSVLAPALHHYREKENPGWTYRFFVGGNGAPSKGVGTPQNIVRDTPLHPLIPSDSDIAKKLQTFSAGLDRWVNGGVYRETLYDACDTFCVVVKGLVRVAYGFIALVLVIAYTPLGFYLTPLLGGFRSGTDVALDVINYLRRKPAKRTGRAQMLSRLVSLLGYVANRRDRSGRRYYKRIVIIAHSQGTVLVADALRLLKIDGLAIPNRMAPEFGRDDRGAPPIRVFTMGCPLRQLYARRMPEAFRWEEKIYKVSTFYKVEAWWNAYRSGDYVGRNLWPPKMDEEVKAKEKERESDKIAYTTMYAREDKDETDAKENDCPVESQYEFCLGPGAHTRYWDDSAWEVIDALDRLIATEKPENLERAGRDLHPVDSRHGDEDNDGDDSEGREGDGDVTHDQA